jgi:hypothetical protein
METAPNDSRAALDMLEMTGLAGDSTRFGWGIGFNLNQDIQRKLIRIALFRATLVK